VHEFDFLQSSVKDNVISYVSALVLFVGYPSYLYIDQNGVLFDVPIVRKNEARLVALLIGIF